MAREDCRSLTLQFKKLMPAEERCEDSAHSPSRPSVPAQTHKLQTLKRFSAMQGREIQELMF